MATKRRYGDGCAIATALDHVGERWALLVVRELLLGPKRFTDVQDGLPRAGAKVLAQRLRELEDAGVVRRRALPPPAASQVYELTEWGSGLEGVVLELGRWGATSPAASGDDVSADSAMLRLRTLFAPQPQRPWTADYEVRLGRPCFSLRVLDGELVELRSGEPTTPPDTTIESDPNTLSRLMGDDRAVPAAIEDGQLTITGDKASGRRLLRAVRLPPQTP